MSMARTLLVAASASVASAFHVGLLAQSGAQASPPVVGIVNSPADGLRTPNTALRIAIRDSDQPDQPIDQAYVVVSRADSVTGDPERRAVSTNDRGLVTMRLSGGDYVVSVRRVGYHEARFAIHIRSSCEQVLEVYITQAIYRLDRCQVRTAGSPPCDPDPPPTPSRVVLTTCAHAA